MFGIKVGHIVLSLFQRMANNPLLDLEKLSSDNAFSLLEEFPDDKAVDSEYEGDSDAEDGVAFSTFCNTDISSSRSSSSILPLTPVIVPTPSTFEDSDPDKDGSVSRHSLLPLTPVISLTPSTSKGFSSVSRPSNSRLNQQTYGKLRKRIPVTADIDDFQDFDSDDSIADPDFELGTALPTKSILEQMTSSDDDDEDLELPMSSNLDETFKKSDCTPTAFNAYTFSQPFGPTFEVNLESPSSIFHVFMTDDMMNHIVTESNKYASQMGVQLNMDVSELNALFGILVIMGFHSLPSMKKYWSTNSNFRVERIASIMTLKRFLKLLRYLHLNDNATMPQRNTPNFDKLYKVRPLINHLNTKFYECFNPSRNMAVDESMVAFKGRSSLRQYMPMKPIKRGFKVWVIADSRSGFMLQFSVYEGKSKEPEEGSTLGERVVMQLVRNYLDKGYCIFFLIITSVLLIL